LRTGSAPGTDLDDAQLLRRFLGHGDQAAFTAIVQRYGALVWGVCARRLGETPEAEDAFQATFLVLVRKAPGLRQPQRLGPWLHGVAHRTALKAHGRTSRLRARERALAEPADLGSPVAPEQLWGELRPLLDEELNRLPEKYRRAVLLCYLEGLSHEEAARALGCPKGTIFSRLSRARDLLRRRLARRGLGVTGALLATVLTAKAVTAAPGPLVETTIGLSLRCASGAAKFSVPAHITALVEGVLRSMYLSNVKLAVALLLVVGLAGSGVGLLAHRDPAGAATAQGAAAPAAPPGLAAKDEGQDAPVPVAAGKSEPAQPAAAKADADQAKPDAPPAKDAVALDPLAWRNGLTAPMKFGGFDDPATQMAEVLGYLEKLFGYTFEVNEKAFQEDGLQHVRDSRIGEVPKMGQTSLANVLRIILARIPAPSGAVFALRSGSIEITTAAALRQELGMPAQRPLLPLVWDEFQNTPIERAFERVAELSGFNVVIDPRVADKTKTRANAQLNNVPTDTAVRLLADMAGLAAVRLDNVFYVTTRENARTLQADQERLNADKPPAQPPQKSAADKPAER
jgi:RNA polymerase sigma factor (sigma-70 family)